MIIINGEIHSSKNSRRIFNSGGKPFVAKSKASKADEEMLSIQLFAQRFEWLDMRHWKSYPLLVVFYFRRKTKARWDFLNLSQGVADAMVKAGYIPDDDVTHFIPVWGGYKVDKLNPGVDFYIK